MKSIETEIDEFNKKTLPTNPSFAPSLRAIIDLINLYWMSKFKGGDLDSNNFRKSFYNIVNSPTEIAAKTIDLDTKDVRVIAENGQSYYPAWLFGKELKIWMKDEKNKDGKTFGQWLNEIVFNYPKYGHILVKKTKNTVSLVPLENVYVEPGAKNYMASEYLIEEHEYSPSELRKQTGWKNIENVIKNFTVDGKIKVYERYGVTDDPDVNFIVLPHRGTKKKLGENDILFKGEIDREKVYKELKWEDVPGRALGRGQVEKLFEAQIAKNENESYLRAGYRWTAKHIFQSRDDTMAKNLISEIDDGEVLTVNSEITPVAMEERNLAALNTGDSKWDTLISKLGFSFEPLSGERPPSGTPLGTSILQTKLSGQYYDLKREELGMFIKSILFEWILPGFAQQKKGVHGIMLGEFDEEELEKLNALISKNRINKEIWKFIVRNERIPTMEDVDVITAVTREQLKTAKEINIPEGYYDNMKYKIDIVITNEQIDMASKMTTLQTILQIIGSNPTILQEKRTRRVFYKLLDLAGISPTDFQGEGEPDVSQMIGDNVAQRGGSVPRAPTPSPTPQTTSVPRTL